MFFINRRWGIRVIILAIIGGYEAPLGDHGIGDPELLSPVSLGLRRLKVSVYQEDWARTGVNLFPF